MNAAAVVTLRAMILGSKSCSTPNRAVAGASQPVHEAALCSLGLNRCTSDRHARDDDIADPC